MMGAVVCVYSIFQNNFERKETKEKGIGIALFPCLHPLLPQALNGERKCLCRFSTQAQGSMHFLAHSAFPVCWAKEGVSLVCHPCHRNGSDNSTLSVDAAEGIVTKYLLGVPSPCSLPSVARYCSQVAKQRFVSRRKELSI